VELGPFGGWLRLGCSQWRQSGWRPAFMPALAQEAAPETAEQPAAEAASPAAEAASDAPTGPDVVEIGAYLNDVQAIDLRNHNYMVDFYIWFRWRNPDIDPAASLEFVNHSESWGTIITNSYETPETLDDGQLYQSMHVQGRMSRKLDLRNYPFDRQSITIEIEDAALNVEHLQYKVDQISANPELKLPGFQYGAPTMRAYDYTHPTNFGDTRESEGGTYSRVSIELPIARPTINAIVKNVLPVLLTTICASFVFLLHPSLVDSRFQIAIFSIISIVALQITVGEDLPTIEYLTLLDLLYLFAYVYCIAVIGALVYATKLSREEGRMTEAIKVDRLGGGLMFGAYLVASGTAIADALRA
jgi:hypothetical protein